MIFKLRYTQVAHEDLDSLDAAVADRIARKIREYVKSGQPLRLAKSLTGKFSGHYRFRIGAYRAIFRIEEGGVVRILLIMRIDRRDKIYE